MTNSTASSKIIASFPTRKYLKIIVQATNNISGLETHTIRLNDDATNNNYARRFVYHAGSSITSVTSDSDALVNLSYGASGQIGNGEILVSNANVTNQVKVANYSVGSSSETRIGYAAWKNITTTVTSVSLVGSTNGIAAGSQLIVLGRN